MEAETTVPVSAEDDLQARHRKERRELQARITNKKHNATKKTRKRINEECTELERQLKKRQEAEMAAADGGADANGVDDGNHENGDAVEDEGRDDGVLEGNNGKILDEALANAQRKLKRIQFAPESIKPKKEASTSQNLPEQTANGTESSQQQQPPKRNRQKERLARRAAEREEQVQVAEKEAANMKNHGHAEQEAMVSQFKELGLLEHDIPTDGHCLFASVADQLQEHDIPIGGDGADAAPHLEVRKRAGIHMMEHQEDFVPFLDEDLAGYVERMTTSADWGGQLELMAIANVYGVEVKVVQQAGRTETISPSAATSEKDQKTIWLAYYRHRYRLGEHYNSLRPSPSRDCERLN